MNIAQVNQPQKSQPVGESKQTEPDASLLHAFKGQLQFAENDLNLMSHQNTKGDSLRDRQEAVEEKRKDEDQEKSVALSYWSDQNLETRYQESLNAKNQGQALQNLSAMEKQQTRQQLVENAVNQKKLNQEIGTDRILQHKPHVISSALQEEGVEQPKREFAELMLAKQNAKSTASSPASNTATIGEFPAEAAQFSQLPNQGQVRPIRDALPVKGFAEKTEGLKAPALQTGSQKSSSTIDQQPGKHDPLTASKEGKQLPTKADGFATELNASVKDNLKAENAASTKQPQAKEPEQQQNVRDVANNIKIMLSSGRDTIVIRLTPEHLGKLEIKLKKAGELLTGEFKVESAEAKKLLSAEFAQLQQDLENQGIKLDQFSVYVKGEENSAFSQNSSHGQQHQDLSAEQQANQVKPLQQEMDAGMPRISQSVNPESGINIVI